jgi:hypothetical protein
MWAVAVFVLASSTILLTTGQQVSATIVPGHALGPVMLGMPTVEARAAAASFEYGTGCGIDLLAAGGRVIAAGSSWGGCLLLQPPNDVRPLPVSTDSFVQSVIFGMSGSPAALVNAFGTPRVIREGMDSVALVFTNGLAAYVGVMHKGGVVTYLAVQNPGSTTAPRIGYFAGTVRGLGRPFDSEAKSGAGGAETCRAEWTSVVSLLISPRPASSADDRPPVSTRSRNHRQHLNIAARQMGRVALSGRHHSDCR